MLSREHPNKQPDVNDLITFTYSYEARDAYFNSVYFLPDDIGIVISMLNTTEGILCEIFSGGEIMLDIPVEKICVNSASG